MQLWELGFMGEEVLYDGSACLSLLLVSRKKELPSKLLSLVPFFSSRNREKIVGGLVDNDWPTFLDWVGLIYPWSLAWDFSYYCHPQIS